MPEQAQFDQMVLELIEHSPTGAVPRTPTHDDAIQRLLAARQIYPDADHREGWVTARSLTRLPSFHAANWEEFVAGRIGPELLEPNASVFNRYVASLAAGLRPRAEVHRLRAAGKPVLHRARHGAVFKDPIHTLFLAPGSGPNRGLPGNYLHGALLQLADDGRTGAWAIDVHDSDDGVALFDAPNLETAAGKLQELLECAPFHLQELVGLGFRMK